MEGDGGAGREFPENRGDVVTGAGVGACTGLYLGAWMMCHKECYCSNLFWR